LEFLRSSRVAHPRRERELRLRESLFPIGCERLSSYYYACIALFSFLLTFATWIILIIYCCIVRKFTLSFSLQHFLPYSKPATDEPRSNYSSTSSANEVRTKRLLLGIAPADFCVKAPSFLPHGLTAAFIRSTCITLLHETSTRSHPAVPPAYTSNHSSHSSDLRANQRRTWN
jgi:hypothetical protein